MLGKVGPMGGRKISALFICTVVVVVVNSLGERNGLGVKGGRDGEWRGVKGEWRARVEATGDSGRRR